MSEMFQVNASVTYSLKYKNELYSRNPKTVTYGTEYLSFLASKIWSIVLEEIENSKSLDSFLKSIMK